MAKASSKVARRTSRETARKASSKASLQLDDMLPYLMNRLVSRLNQNLAEDLRRHGFTFQDWRVIAVLAAHDGANLTELAEATVIPQPSVSRLIANLARRGYVKREIAESDSRICLLYTSPSPRD